MSGRLHAKSTVRAKAKPTGRKTAPSGRRASTTASSPKTARPTGRVAGTTRSRSESAPKKRGAPSRPKTTAPGKSATRSSSAVRKVATRGAAVAAGTRAAGKKASAAKAPTAKAPTAKRTSPRAAGAGQPKSNVRTADERAAIEARRNRMPVYLAAVAAIVILATSFPLSVLFSQRQHLSAEAAQLHQLRHQSSLLGEQRQQLNSDAEVKRLARQNYQLVLPGQSLYDILPAAGLSTTPGSPTAGDPANQPLVSPAQAPNMSPDPGLPAASAPTGSSTSPSAPTASTPVSRGGFWNRVRATLEFWR